MPPKKRTFNDYTSNPNAPTKKNAAKRKKAAEKKRGWGKRGERTLSTPYTKEDFFKEWVLDQDDPVDVVLTMSGLGWLAKGNKARKRLKNQRLENLNISEQTDKLQKRLKKILKRKHKGKTLEGTVGSSPHGKPLSSTDPDGILFELEAGKRLKNLDKKVAKVEKQLDKTIKEHFKKLMDDVDMEVKRRHSIEFPEMSLKDWAALEKEGTRGMLGSKTPLNRYGHGKGIMKKIARATGGTHKDANRLARKLQKADEAIKRQLKADKKEQFKKMKAARKKSQKEMNKAGRSKAGTLERGLPKVISPRYDPLKQYSNRQN